MDFREISCNQKVLIYFPKMVIEDSELERCTRGPYEVYHGTAILSAK